MDQLVNVSFQEKLTKMQWKEFLCGWGAACINITVMYPINKLVLRQVIYKILVIYLLYVFKSNKFRC